jgi:lysophospholipase L1-like esterase
MGIPKSVLLRKLNTEAAGKNAKALIGDVNGDGRMELVMVQVNRVNDDRYEPHQVQCITTYDLNGNVLWQVGIPNEALETSDSFGSDYPAQIADIDGDGKNEVLCIMNKKFYILDGNNGSVKKKYKLPDNKAHDCIIVANLTGGTYPQDIILKNRYSKMWAMDKDFNLLWEYEGNIGHYPWVYDINGDGRDEIMAGFDMLDSNGNILWSCNDLGDHADCITIGDFNYNPARGVEIAIGGGSNFTVLYDWKGSEVWRYKGAGKTQHIAVGNFRDDMIGVQIAGLDHIEWRDIERNVNDKIEGNEIFLLDRKGNEILKENREISVGLTIIETFYNWDGLKRDHILTYGGGGVFPTLYNGFLEPIVEFPVDGYVVHGDLIGDGTECAIIYANGVANIFAHKDINLDLFKNKTIKQSKRLAHSTLYRGADIDNIAQKNPKVKSVEGNFKELRYNMDIENGIYNVCIIFGGKNDISDVERVEIGDRRLVLKSIKTLEGNLEKRVFSVNVLDNELHISVKGSNPIVNGIEVLKAEATTIFLAGDSTVANLYDEPYTGWGQVLPCFFNEGVAISNHAFLGRSVVSFMKEKRLDDILAAIKPNDYLFMQFGHNDPKPGAFYADAFGRYKELLKLYIHKARDKGAKPVLVNSLVKRVFDENERVINAMGDYPEAMRELAKEENIPLLELNRLSEDLLNELGKEKSKDVFLHVKPHVYEEYPNGIKDDTHLSEYGALKMAEIIVEEIKAKNLNLAKYLRGDNSKN